MIQNEARTNREEDERQGEEVFLKISSSLETTKLYIPIITKPSGCNNVEFHVGAPLRGRDALNSTSYLAERLFGAFAFTAH